MRKLWVSLLVIFGTLTGISVAINTLFTITVILIIVTLFIIILPFWDREGLQTANDLLNQTNDVDKNIYNYSAWSAVCSTFLVLLIKLSPKRNPFVYSEKVFETDNKKSCERAETVLNGFDITYRKKTKGDSFYRIYVKRKKAEDARRLLAALK